MQSVGSSNAFLRRLPQSPVRGYVLLFWQTQEIVHITPAWVEVVPLESHGILVRFFSQAHSTRCCQNGSRAAEDLSCRETSVASSPRYANEHNGLLPGHRIAQEVDQILLLKGAVEIDGSCKSRIGTFQKGVLIETNLSRRSVDGWIPGVQVASVLKFGAKKSASELWCGFVFLGFVFLQHVYMYRVFLLIDCICIFLLVDTCIRKVYIDLYIYIYLSYLVKVLDLSWRTGSVGLSTKFVAQ